MKKAAHTKAGGGTAAAKQGDRVVGVDTHVVLVPSPGGPVPTPTPLPFSGPLGDALAASVKVDGRAIATVGSVATNSPAHVAPSGPFQRPPTNRATVSGGSATVLAGGKGVARAGDPAKTCNDPADQPNGSIVAAGTVLVGG
ncbi:MAG TPA: PAAR domain-containing protein [Byssovorax sp.]|jgi:uncharacterized Zn-binding protein involved in type VI secretion